MCRHFLHKSFSFLTLLHLPPPPRPLPFSRCFVVRQCSRKCFDSTVNSRPSHVKITKPLRWCYFALIMSHFFTVSRCSDDPSPRIYTKNRAYRDLRNWIPRRRQPFTKPFPSLAPAHYLSQLMSERCHPR